MTTPLSILKAARERLSDPARWCQNVAARSATGRALAPTHKAAASWCILGAVEACANEQGNDGHSIGRVAALLYSEVKRLRGFGAQTSIYNDTSTHKEVLALLDAAIKTAATDDAGPDSQT